MADASDSDIEILPATTDSERSGKPAKQQVRKKRWSNTLNHRMKLRGASAAMSRLYKRSLPSSTELIDLVSQDDEAGDRDANNVAGKMKHVDSRLAPSCGSYPITETEEVSKLVQDAARSADPTVSAIADQTKQDDQSYMHSEQVRAAKVFSAIRKTKTYRAAGFAKPSSQYTGENIVVLCRSNGAMLNLALQMTALEKSTGSGMHRPASFYVQGGIQRLCLDRLAEFAKFAVHSANGAVERAAGPSSGKGSRRVWNDPVLRRMRDWSALLHYTLQSKDFEVVRLVNVVELITPNRIPDMVKRVKECARAKPCDADVTLSTVHQAKGLEWDEVVIANDFNLPKVFSSLAGVPSLATAIGLADRAIERRIDAGTSSTIEDGEELQ